MVTLINIVSVKPGVQQSAVIDSLHQNTKSDIKTLKGRQSISIIAPFDCEEVVQPGLPAGPDAIRHRFLD